MRIIHSALVSSVAILLLGGCSGTKSWTYLRDPNDPRMMQESDVVLDGVLTSSVRRQNLSLSELLRFGAPARPRYGWKADVVFEPYRTIKGTFRGDRIPISDLKIPPDLDAEQNRAWGMHHPIRIGFRQRLLNRTADLKIAPLLPPAD